MSSTIRNLALRRFAFVSLLGALAPAASAQVRLSQVYGSGGNSQSVVRADYIELYNAGAPQDLTGWSVQYASSTGTTWSVTPLPAVVLGTGRYLLVQEALGTTLGAGYVPDVPAVDATGTIAMSATDFKIALVSSTTALVGGTPTYAGAPSLVDFVGAGTANWNESAANGAVFSNTNNAPPASTAHALYRGSCGATDTGVNRDDWAVGFPAPRNTATGANAGLTVIGTALPLTLEPGQSTRLTATPWRCATSDLGAGTVLTVDTSLIGGGVVALVDDGTGADEVGGDGVYTALVTVGAGTASASVSLPLAVSDSGGNSGASYISIFVTPASAQDNDNCATATPLAVPSTTSGTFTDARPESNPLASAGAAPTSGMSSRRGLWYSVVGTGNTMTASMCATTPALDTVVFVLAGTCDGLTVIASGDDNGPACSGTPGSAAWCSVAGQSYWIWIAPFSTAVSTAAFTLDVSDNGTACAGGFPVTMCSGTAGPFSEVEPGYGTHTNDGCTSTPNRFVDIAAPGPGGVTLRGTARGMMGNRDVDWYRFLATTSGPIQVSIDTLGSQAQAQVFSLSPGGLCPPVPSTALFFTPIVGTRCATGTQVISGNVTAGTWYGILVVGGVSLQVTPGSTVFGGQMPGGTTYQYEMNVSIGAAPLNDACAAATTLTGTSVAGNLSTATNDGSSSCDVGGRDVWYSFTAGTNAGTLSLNTCGATFDTAIAVFDACGGTELACNDDCGGTPCAGPGSCTSAPVAAGQTVKVRVSDKLSAGDAFTLNWSFAVPPPANDECVGATVIAGNGPFPYDNRFATPASAAPGSTCQASQSKDIWFLWYPAGSGSVTLDTCGGPTWDPVMTVYTGSCGALTEIACDDDSCTTPALGSTLTFSATCGTPYYIRISSFSTTTGMNGSFNLVGTVAAAGLPFCPGDGTGTACPCGNNSTLGANEGCLNSFGTGGKLVATGCTSLTTDSVVLLGSQMPNASALYFQGTTQQSGGAGAAFGDGLRCAGGTVIRLKTVTNSGGASQYPQPGDASVSVRGLVTSPGVRTYQVWYRNAAAFCTASTFNVSNGLEISWAM